MDFVFGQQFPDSLSSHLSASMQISPLAGLLVKATEAKCGTNVASEMHPLSPDSLCGQSSISNAILPVTICFSAQLSDLARSFSAVCWLSMAGANPEGQLQAAHRCSSAQLSDLARNFSAVC